MAKFGISKETRSTTLKAFTPKADKFNGLSLGELVEVSVSDVEAKDPNGGWGEFYGMAIPKLNFVFKEVVTEKGMIAGTYVYSRTPMVHVPNSDDNDWWFDQTFQTIKHLIDVYSNDVWNDAYDALLALPLEDGEMESQAVLDAYRQFFNGVATVFNGNEENKVPNIVKAGTVLKKVWMKLVLYVKGKEVNRGAAGFPGYPGDGIVELYKDGVAPSIRINIAKGESIIPVAKTNATPGGVPGANSSTPPTAAAGTNNSGVPDWMAK